MDRLEAGGTKARAAHLMESSNDKGAAHRDREGCVMQVEVYRLYLCRDSKGCRDLFSVIMSSKAVYRIFTKYSNL